GALTAPRTATGRMKSCACWWSRMSGCWRTRSRGAHRWRSTGHSSKSPSTIRTQKELVRQLGSNLLAVNQRHERLIDGLLTLASTEQGITERVSVDLADIARRITTESQVAVHAARLEIRTDVQGAPVIGDPVLLERLMQTCSTMRFATTCPNMA